MNVKGKSNIFCLGLILLLAGCSSKLVYNEGFPKTGPMFVEATVPVPEPIPEPEPAPQPEPEPTIAELNERAVESFTEVGLEAEQTDRGVVVYLPPEIYFQSSAAKIDLDARQKIAQIANEVNKDYLAARQIEITGHTDAAGSPENNLALSKMRAVAAAGELVFSRVAETRLKTMWKGESAPRYPEIRSDGTVNYKNRARNRRVEFTILNPGQD